NLQSEISRSQKNPARCGREVVDNRIGGQVRPPSDLGGAGAAADEDTARADGLRKPDVDPLVANDERPLRIQIQIARGAVDEAACRLAAVAGARVRGD